MIFKVLDLVIFKPIMIIMEMLYNAIMQIACPQYISLFLFSFILNIILLPLFLRMDSYQVDINNKQKFLKEKTAIINKCFKGDERLFALHTLYKQNGYGLLYVLKSSLPLIIELIFFVCSFRVLSSQMELMKNTLFDNIFKKEIVLPFTILNCNIVYINILPIAMTLINIISGLIYNDDLSRKKIIQLLAIPVIFLAILYNSPTMLVLYYVYNNIFSLIKNIILKYKRKIYRNNAFIIDKSNSKANNTKFIIISAFNVIFFSIFIPLRFVNITFKEFFLSYNNINFIVLIIQLFLISFGLFVLWGGLIYCIIDDRRKDIYLKILTIISFLFILNFLLFALSGTIYSVELYIQEYKPLNIYLAITPVFLIVLLYYLLFIKNTHFVYSFMIFVIISLIVASFVYMKRIFPYAISKNDGVSENVGNKIKKFSISTNGKNVIIIVLDTAAGRYIPYIFQEEPELKEIYSGFRYYPNVITHGAWTELGLPAIFGGYEYTPVELNKRKNDLFINKQIEAYNVLPSIFKNNSFNVNIYDINKVSFKVPFNNGLESRDIKTKKIYDEEIVLKRFTAFAFTMASPSIFHKGLYNSGNYLCSNMMQYPISYFEAAGRPTEYENEYNDLQILSSICEVTDNAENNYISVLNNITHPPVILLQTPNYSIADKVNNKDYYINNRNKFIINNKYLFEGEDDGVVYGDDLTKTEMYKYSANAGAIRCISDFIKFLKKNNVYDNTRIIIVSDHASSFSYISSLLNFPSPVLMFKDFYSTGFIEDNTFMTNADVPIMALKDIVNNPINPFSGKVVNDSEKTSHKQFLYCGGYYSQDGEYVLRPSQWASIYDSIFDIDKWEYTEGKYILDKYELPKEDVNKILKE